MSIASYSDLTTAVQTWLLNTTISGNVADFVMLGQLRVYRELRIRTMESALSSTIASDGTLTVPSDYLTLKNAYVNTSPIRSLKRTLANYIRETYPSPTSGSGIPMYIAREGSYFIFGPQPDSQYTIKGIYYAQPTLLSVSNTTNWFTANAPDILLFASLLEAVPFLKNDDRIPIWEQKYLKSRDDLQQRESEEATSGSDIAMHYSTK